MKRLLLQSPPIDHEDWKQYDFEFKPETDMTSLTISVGYVPGATLPYSGHVLVDNISEIVLVRD
jgi:hypothetical protein